RCRSTGRGLARLMETGERLSARSNDPHLISSLISTRGNPIGPTNALQVGNGPWGRQERVKGNRTSLYLTKQPREGSYFSTPEVAVRTYHGEESLTEFQLMHQMLCSWLRLCTKDCAESAEICQKAISPRAHGG